MKNIIVLGASGQLGQTIKELSKQDGFNFKYFSHRELDISDITSLNNAFQDIDFQYCINCAAFTNVDLAETQREKAFQINSLGPKNIAQICDGLGVKLIHISTDYVFNGKSNSPYKENDQKQPVNVYGASKLQGEMNVIKSTKKCYIIRTAWLYSQYGNNFLKTILKTIKNNEPLFITTGETGTPTSCQDLAEFILHIIKEDNIEYGIYHFSSRGYTTWYGFAKEIVSIYNKNKLQNIKAVDKFKTIAKRPKYSVLDLHKTEAVYKKIRTWQESLYLLLNKFDKEDF